MGYTERQQQVKDAFIEARGAWKWNDTWETILELNPEILDAYSTLSGLPHRRSYLGKKTTGMILVAIDGACTHLHIPGMRNHLRHGLEDLGITPAEFLEAMAIATTLGVTTYTAGLPILTEELKKRGIDRGDMPLTAEQERQKQAFISQNGHWNDLLERCLRLDPEYLSCYGSYLSAISRGGALEPKVREFLYIAVNAAPSAVNREDLARHISTALDLGATKEEILEVFELVSTQGIHTVTLGVPALNDIMEDLGMK